MLNVAINDRLIIEDLRTIVRTEDRTIYAGHNGVVEEESSYKGSDEIGTYISKGLRLREQFINHEGKTVDKSTALLEIRTYDDLGIAVARTECFIHWGQGFLAQEAGLRIEFDSLAGLKNLLALYMMSDCWMGPHFGSDVCSLPNRTQMLLWQTDDGLYGCLLPLLSGGCRCDANSKTGKPGVDISYLDGGQNRFSGDVFVVGIGKNPFELINRCFIHGMTAAGHPGKLRWEKIYPEVFEYIGWCTWDALYHNQNEKDILKKLRAFKKSRFPIRFLLIDDGWSPTENGQLVSFDIDRKKFPRGLAPLAKDAREKYGVWWTGLWHTFTGYWGGVHRDSEAYHQQKENIFESKRDTQIPYPELGRGINFWNHWHSWMRMQGVSFVKVDNQCGLAAHTAGSMPIGIAAKGAQYALQASVELNLDGWLLNCMAMNAEAAWHWIVSNVARTSDDFWPKNPASSNRHVLQNCYNALMFANIVWPDWDMWWSDHPRGRLHAAMRAISGGPVYVSDPIDTSDFEVMWPLVFSDGRVLRCDEPALPTRDSLFINPSDNPIAIKMWNTVGEAGMLAAFNATEGEKVAKGTIKPSDVEGIDGERFAVREFFSGECRVMSLNETWEFELPPYGYMLWSVVPIQDGIAVIGLANKYISPAAVLTSLKHSERGGTSLVVELYEGGQFLAYCESKPRQVRVNDRPNPYVYNDGWLTVKCRAGRPALITVRF